jgi:NOL1/NOP2/fmu family ribosome biogenesis protein
MVREISGRRRAKMRESLRFLNSKERKELLARITERWGSKVSEDYVFLMNTKNKIFMVSRDVERIELEKIRVNNIGLYFGEITERDELRLSIEGASIVGRSAERNVIEVSSEQARQWFAGGDIDVEDERNGFMIVRSAGDVLGCGKLTGKRLLNFVPKARRIEAMM